MSRPFIEPIVRSTIEYKSTADDIFAGASSKHAAGRCGADDM
jgi:hypothetical protein